MLSGVHTVLLQSKTLPQYDLCTLLRLSAVLADVSSAKAISFSFRHNKFADKCVAGHIPHMHRIIVHNVIMVGRVLIAIVMRALVHAHPFIISQTHFVKGVFLILATANVRPLSAT